MSIKSRNFYFLSNKQLFNLKKCLLKPPTTAQCWRGRGSSKILKIPFGGGKQFSWTPCVRATRPSNFANRELRRPDNCIQDCYSTYYDISLEFVSITQAYKKKTFGIGITYAFLDAKRPPSHYFVHLSAFLCPSADMLIGSKYLLLDA